MVKSGLTAQGRALAGFVSSAFRLGAAAGHVRLLDGWRGLCIALVIAGHFLPAVGFLAAAGVEFFFVLSGRLMAEILIVRRQALGLFARRRAARILPALWTYVAIVGAAMAGSAWLGAANVGWLSPAAAFLFFYNYVPDSATSAFLHHTWSLAVEEHSYILLAAVAMLATRDARRAALLATAVAALAMLNGVRLWLWPPEDQLYAVWRSDVRAASVLISFAFYLRLRPLLERARGRWPAWLSPACAAASIFCLSFPPPLDPLRMTLGTLFAAVAVNSVEQAAPLFRTLLERPLPVWLGTLSFSLYLWQQPFYAVAKLGALPMLPALALAILCALWSFKRVEQPARAWLNGRWDRPSRLQLPPGTQQSVA